MVIKYDRVKAVEYAKKWAYDRNPNYYNFNELGGDCTNFISQCLFNGCSIMNYTNVYGWYYKNLNDRSPAWTGVNELRNFLINNNGENGIVGNGNGPFARISNLTNAQIGDVIQLYNGYEYYHSLMIVGFNSLEPLIASHTENRFNYPLYNYNFNDLVVLHVEGARI